MGSFGIGAALPLLLLGLLSREAMLKWRNKLLGAGQNGKVVLGVILAVIGLLVSDGLRQADRSSPRRRLTRMADGTDDEVLIGELP